MPDRVGKVALASPVAPFDEPGVTKMLVMKDLKMIAMLRHLHHLLKWLMHEDAKKIVKDIPSYVEAMAHELPGEAKTMLRNPEKEALFDENFRLGYMQDEEGIYEMTMALWGWGFSPKSIVQPVDLFYGTADDIISPKMPLHLCAELPHCTSHAWEGAAHYGFVDREHWSQFVSAAVQSPH
jgi:pimeloyl-ACP methyl ester carboxylesterase